LCSGKQEHHAGGTRAQLWEGLGFSFSISTFCPFCPSILLTSRARMNASVHTSHPTGL
jgi:hypothetical protein